jgi:hypothetical protein
MHPIPDPCRDGDPYAVLGIAQNKVNLADRLSIDMVCQHPGFSIACHDFQPIRTEVGDQNVAIVGECKAIRKGSFDVTGRLGRRVSETRRMPLGNDLLLSIGAQVHNAAARVRNPQGSIGLGQNTFRPLQVTAGILQTRLCDLKVEYRICLLHA